MLLIQGTMASIQELINDLGALPLAERKIDLKQNQRTILAFSIFALALAIVAFEILPADITFLAATILMVLTKVLTIQSALHAIDLPIIFLLGAIIPVSHALETTRSSCSVGRNAYERHTGYAYLGRARPAIVFDDVAE